MIEVISTIGSGQCIEDYPNDNPFPSTLLALKLNGRFIHVVIGIGEENDGATLSLCTSRIRSIFFRAT